MFEKFMSKVKNSEAADSSPVQGADRAAEAIENFGRVITKKDHTIESVIIAGQIEGHASLPPPAKATQYERIIPELVFAEENDEIDGVLFLINTVGGDVEAGLAIAEMIAGMTKPTVSLVLGGGHSIGIPLAVAAKKSFIVPSATMTVHPVRVNGLILGAEQSWEYLMRMQDRITDFVVENSRVTKEKFTSLLQGRSDMATDIGTILDGREAVESGIITSLGTFREAMAALKEAIERKKASS